MKLSHLFYASPLGRILLAVLAILFTLCVGTTNAASDPGTVTILLGVEPESLDPGNTSSNVEGSVLMRNIVETLTEMNPADGSIVPRLATSWKQIDGTTWQFTLRKGVKFHDGKDFNAEAVVYNIRRLYDKKIPSSVRANYFSSTEMTGKALDSHTLEVKLGKPEPLLPTLMGTLALCSPNTPLDKLTRNPIGTGPYKFVKWDAGMQIVVERFDGYWGKRSQVQQAIYVWRKESGVRAAMVLIGEADLAPNIAALDANRPEMDHSYFNAETTMIRIGGEWEPPLNDRRFRMALNYAVDRDAIRGSILSKDVVPATQTITPSNFGYNPNLKPWPYDPRKAKQLLDEARKDGVAVDREIVMTCRPAQFPGIEELSEAVMTMFKAVGLNVKLKVVEAAVERTYSRKPYPKNVGPYLLLKSHGNAKGDAAFTVFFNYHCNGNNSSMCDKTVDELIEKAQVASGEKRRDLWQAAFKRIHEEIIPEVVLFHMVGYCRVGNRINYVPTITTIGEVQLAQITFK